MKKALKELVFVLITIVACSSCSKEGDDWTLAKTISLGDVSLRVPDTYSVTTNTSEKIEVGNGFDGNSVAILMEDVAGRTQDEIFTYKTKNYSYGTPTSVDTTLIGHPTRKLEASIAIAVGVAHTITSFIFIHKDKVYTLEYAWSENTYYKSIALMNEMLASLTMN